MVAARELYVNWSTVYRWVQRFLPLFSEAAKPHRHPSAASGGSMKRTCASMASGDMSTTLLIRWGKSSTLTSRSGGMLKAAQAFFEQAIAETRMTPKRVKTDKAKSYPPGLPTLLTHVEHRRSRYLNNGLERDLGHLKQRLCPMRCFKQAASAQLLVRGDALVQNLRKGSSLLRRVQAEGSKRDMAIVEVLAGRAACKQTTRGEGLPVDASRFALL